MKTGKPDRRTERTRQALMSAFVDLILSQGYDAVTVEDIAARANVGRSTVYLHYTGKEALMRESLSRPSSHLAVLVGHDIAPDGLLPILEHFHEQRKINRIFFAEPIRAIWTRRLGEMIEPRLAAVSRHAGGRPLLPLPLAAAQIAAAQIGLVAAWLVEKPSHNPLAIAEALIAVTRGLVTGLLNPRAGASLFIPGERLRYVAAQTKAPGPHAPQRHA